MDRSAGASAAADFFSPEAFRAADTPLQPAYTWVWNDRVTERTVRRRLSGMRKAGIRAVYVLAEPRNFRPDSMRTFLSPDYLSDGYLRLLRTAAETAFSLGMEFWLYDEGGWPSGSAAGRTVRAAPSLARTRLKKKTVTLPAGEPYRPEDGGIAAFAGETRVPEGARFGETAVLTLFVAERSGGGPCPAADGTAKGAGETFVRETHDLLAGALGDLLGNDGENGARGIPLLFTDEPGSGPFPWPEGFAETFISRFGYDLRDWLPALTETETDVSGAALRARQDYRALLGALFRENYFMPIRRWCREHGLLLTGHLDKDHLTEGCLAHGYGTVLEQLRMLDVPGVDVIWRQIGFPRGDGPVCAEGNGFFERFASSAAAQSGGKLALSESFAVYGAGLTGETARFVLNHQLVRGINLFNFMTAAVSARGALALQERPVFTEEQPGFFHLRAMNDYTARACYLMRLGAPGARCAVYYPARELWSGGTRAKRAAAAFGTLGRALEARQVDFDVIDEYGLAACAREDGALKLGFAVYDCVLIPADVSLPEALREKLRGLREAPEPTVVCDRQSLRARRRLLPDGGRIYMLLNESAAATAARVVFPEAGPRILLDPQTGDAFRDAGDRIAFAPGEAKFYLFPAGDADFADPPRAAETTLPLTAFTLRKTRESLIGTTGLTARRCREEAVSADLGGWARYFGADFSGEAVYETAVRLATAPQPGERYLLRLGRVETTARVTVNGREAGVVWAPPYTLPLDGAVFGGRRTLRLRIEVANTLCNRLNAADLQTLFPPETLGPYAPRLAELEKDFPAGGLYGPVLLEKLKG